MAIKSVKKSFGSNKNINYVGKDFDSLKENLIQYAKTYFPNTYSDFNESSPGMVFIEMASYIGDVLAFYQDTQLKESMLAHATERKNVVALAQAMGYKPKVTSPAVTTLTIYQLVPSIYNSNASTGTEYEPDASYYLKIKDGMEVAANSNSSIIFRTVDSVDFANPADREIDVYERDTNGIPQFYLITKKVKAISATQNETSLNITTTDYPSVTLSDSNIIQIVSITENGEKYYEVPYLAQESIFVEKPNTEVNGELSEYAGTVPYILELQKVPRRYSVKVNSDNTIDIQFGSGDTSLNDEIILPNTKNIGLGLANSITRLNSSIDPSNFLKTNTFGIAPSGQIYLK